MKAGPLSWAQPPCPCILPAPKIIFLTSSSPSSLHAEQHPVSLALRDGSFEEALATLHSVNVEDLHGSDKTSYAARIARFDLLRSINMLARNVTKWTKQDDFKLHHLMSYVNSKTKNWSAGKAMIWNHCKLWFSQMQIMRDVASLKSVHWCHPAFVVGKSSVWQHAIKCGEF